MPPKKRKAANTTTASSSSNDSVSRRSKRLKTASPPSPGSSSSATVPKPSVAKSTAAVAGIGSCAECKAKDKENDRLFALIQQGHRALVIATKRGKEAEWALNKLTAICQRLDPDSKKWDPAAMGHLVDLTSSLKTNPKVEDSDDEDDEEEKDTCIRACDACGKQDGPMTYSAAGTRCNSCENPPSPKAQAARKIAEQLIYENTTKPGNKSIIVAAAKA